MPAAARIGDLTGHASTPLTPASPSMGSINVLIGGLPAWRALTDVHVCALVNGVQPHVGGFVAVGSKTVLINNLPAARQGDQIVEAGGPNPITAGLATVLIGG
jgi:uncharacterized Zn-binding protein involved in type VI secretion